MLARVWIRFENMRVFFYFIWSPQMVFALSMVLPLRPPSLTNLKWPLAARVRHWVWAVLSLFIQLWRNTSLKLCGTETVSKKNEIMCTIICSNPPYMASHTSFIVDFFHQLCRWSPLSGCTPTGLGNVPHWLLSTSTRKMRACTHCASTPNLALTPTQPMYLSEVKWCIFQQLGI